MSPNPRCSVIIPTYNCLELLPLAVASVRMQGIEDIEILVVDDASIDGTAEWLAAETARDPRLIPLHTERKGPSYTRNLALYQARAPIVGFLDADDLWWPNKLARALSVPRGSARRRLQLHRLSGRGPEGEVRGTCFDYWRPGYVDRRSCDFSIVPDAEFELLAVNVVGTSTVVASREALQNANGFAIGVAFCGGLGPLAATCGESSGRLLVRCDRDLSDAPDERHAKQERPDRGHARDCRTLPRRVRETGPPGVATGERADRHRRGRAGERPWRQLGRRARSPSRASQVAAAANCARCGGRCRRGLQKGGMTT